MKIILLSLMALADACPKGDLAACQEYLKKVHSKNQGRDFTKKFDQVCGDNKAFNCAKVPVRGDINTEMVEQTKERGAKAALFHVALEKENYIFAISPK